MGKRVKADHELLDVIDENSEQREEELKQKRKAEENGEAPVCPKHADVLSYDGTCPTCAEEAEAERERETEENGERPICKEHAVYLDDDGTCAECKAEMRYAKKKAPARSGPGGKPRWNGQRPPQVGPGAQTGAADTQAAGAKRPRFRYEWQSAFCAVSDTSRGTGLPPTTRLVLWTVSRYMNPDGSGAYPGQARIAREAALSLLAAKFHLRLAEKRGWLKRERTFKSQYGTGFEYAATIPEGATTLPPLGNDVTQSQGNDVTRSPQGNDVTRSPGTGQRQHKTRVTSAQDPGNDVAPTSKAYHKALPDGAGAGPVGAGRGGTARQEAKAPLNKPSLIRPRPFKLLPGPHRTQPLPGTGTRLVRFELESLKVASSLSLIRGRPSCPWPRVH